MLAVGSAESERIWGLGEHPLAAVGHAPRSAQQLNCKGRVFDFQADQHNTKITIPWLVSSLKYGVFFNHPGWVTLDLTNETIIEWDVTMALQLDFLITTHGADPDDCRKPYAALQTNYYRAIGQPSPLPDWATGFWASKERYASQAEILQVVQNYTAHGIQVDVLVIDWKHYDCVGDWGFTLNPGECWPDPKAMVEKLSAMGVQQIFVSLHPWSQPGSLTYDNMTGAQLCVRYANGTMRPWGGWTLNTCGGGDSRGQQSNCLYDPSNPRSRAFLWAKLKQSYFDAGITNFWTDGTEPAGTPAGGLPSDIVFYSDASNGEVRDLPSPAGFMMWPVWHASTVANGAGKDSWSLARSAWAGSHRHNTIVWSGDIGSTWSTLRQQVTTGQNFQLVYPYWNTDTAGFGGGDWQTMGELFV
eukprot:SAG31_NODE_1404_length_8479_cov_2.258760_8_plen_415_part_00